MACSRSGDSWEVAAQRLSKESYIATQIIYYPGFTIGGIGDGISVIAAIVLLLLTPTDMQAFWWTLAGLISLVAMPYLAIRGVN